MTPKCVLKWPGGKWAIAGWPGLQALMGRRQLLLGAAC